MTTKTQASNGSATKRVDATGHANAGEIRIEGSRAKSTWLDWLRNGGIDEATIAATEELTRDEVIERLAAGGVDVTAYDLQNWQQAGVIPHGIRRRHHGATRLTYPWWMVDLIRSLRELQRDYDAPLRQIASLLAIQALQLATHRDDLPAPAPPPELDLIFRRWVDRHFATYGMEIPRVEVRLIDERGHPLTFLFEMPEKVG